MTELENDDSKKWQSAFFMMNMRHVTEASAQLMKLKIETDEKNPASLMRRLEPSLMYEKHISIMFTHLPLFEI